MLTRSWQWPLSSDTIVPRFDADVTLAHRAAVHLDQAIAVTAVGEAFGALMAPDGEGGVDGRNCHEGDVGAIR